MKTYLCYNPWQAKTKFFGQLASIPNLLQKKPTQRQTPFDELYLYPFTEEALLPPGTLIYIYLPDANPYAPYPYAHLKLRVTELQYQLHGPIKPCLFICVQIEDICDIGDPKPIVNYFKTIWTAPLHSNSCIYE